MTGGVAEIESHWTGRKRERMATAQPVRVPEPCLVLCAHPAKEGIVRWNPSLGV